MDIENFSFDNELDILNAILDRFGVSENHYSFFTDKNNSLCLNYFKDNWITYIKKNNKRSEFKKFSSFDSVCNFIFNTFSSDEEEAKKMKKHFQVLEIQLRSANVEFESAEDLVKTHKNNQRTR